MTHLFTFSPVLLGLIGGPGVDWLYQFTNNLTNLTTQNSDALSSVGMTLLAFVSFIKLVRMVAEWNLSTMTVSLHPMPVRFGDLVEFLITMTISLLIINYWATPFPGASFGFNHLFSYFAQVMVRALDQNSLSQLQSAMDQAVNNTPQPSYLAPLEIAMYVLVFLVMGLASGILFLINCSSFILYGVTALFGPIFVPLLMTQTFRGKFYHFVDVLLSFAMIRAVAALHLRVVRVPHRLPPADLQRRLFAPHVDREPLWGHCCIHRLHPQHCDGADDYADALWRRFGFGWEGHAGGRDAAHP